MSDEPIKAFWSKAPEGAAAMIGAVAICVVTLLFVLRWAMSFRAARSIEKAAKDACQWLASRQIGPTLATVEMPDVAFPVSLVTSAVRDVLDDARELPKRQDETARAGSIATSVSAV